jgi:hypothetical protein
MSLFKGLVAKSVAALALATTVVAVDGGAPVVPGAYIVEFETPEANIQVDPVSILVSSQKDLLTMFSNHSSAICQAATSLLSPA